MKLYSFRDREARFFLVIAGIEVKLTQFSVLAYRPDSECS